MRNILFTLLPLLVGPALCENTGNHSDPLTVRTSTGTYTGLIEPEYPNTRQWRGIPFAEAPVGSRRWLPPQKPSSSKPDQHRYATKYPPSCSQFFSQPETLWNLPLTQGNLIYNGAQNDSSGLIGEATSEDCLYLAVWTPTGPPPDEGGFPVLFFMTGGGFYIGGLELPWQIPTPWVERSQSAIIVTINYRINIFGFPNAAGLHADEQNLGILDQRAALEWVHENIEAFGGDPERITHWGRSAGGIGTDMHSYAYHDDPIANAYYFESGVVFNQLVTADPARSNFTFVAENVGCDAPCGPAGCKDEEEQAAAELDCMRLVSPIQITNFIGQYGDRGETPPLTFGPIADERVVFSDYHARSEQGKIAARPVLISFTANEWAGLTPWPKDNLTEGPWQPPVTELSADFGPCATLHSVSYRNQLGPEAPPVFRFQYAGVFPNLNVYEWLGAYHNSETPLIFGQYRLLDHIADTTEYQIKVSEALQDHIMSFAEDPYNGPQEKFGWQPQVASEPNGGKMLRFASAEGGDVVRQLDGHEVDGYCLGMGEYDPYP